MISITCKAFVKVSLYKLRFQLKKYKTKQLVHYEVKNENCYQYSPFGRRMDTYDNGQRTSNQVLLISSRLG